MIKKLDEVCRFYSGTGFPVAYQGKSDGELPFYKVGDIANNVAIGNVYLSLCNNYISRQEASEIRGSIIPKGTIVFAKIGEALKLNRRAITNCDCLIDNNAMGIAPMKELLRTEYFFYFMKQLKMQEHAETTTVPSVRRSKLEQVEIDVPSLDKQEEIEQILNKTSMLIHLRQQELQRLDDLVKARFVEMFGDSEFNMMQWPTKKLSELCAASSSKRIYQNEQSTEGVPFLRISDLNERIDNVKNAPELFIPINKYNELKENGLVPTEGDILVTSRGTLGRCYIVRPEDEFYFQDGMISWLSDLNSQITSVYLSQLFAMSGIQKQIASLQAGSTVAYLSIAMLKKLNIMLPPLDLQEQFAAFVEQTDKSKVVVQKALDEAQTLFDSLMQEYFG